MANIVRSASMDDSGPRSLLQDWLFRQQFLHGARRNPSDGLFRGQLMALSRLVEDHVFAPWAQQRARFPFKQYAYLNNRVIIVHHHLCNPEIASVMDTDDALRRIRPIVRRMALARAQCRGEALAWHFGLFSRAFHALPAGPTTLARRLHRASPADYRAVASLMRMADSMLAASVGGIESFFGRIGSDARAWHERLMERLDTFSWWYSSLLGVNTVQSRLWALKLLLKLRDPYEDVFEVFWERWQDCATTDADEATLACLEEFFAETPLQHFAAERVRAQLASGNSLIRLRAIRLLAQLENPQDVGLLLDLLALPPALGMGEDEREAILRSVLELSGAKDH